MCLTSHRLAVWSEKSTADRIVIAPIWCMLARFMGTLFQITFIPRNSCAHKAQIKNSREPRATPVIYVSLRQFSPATVAQMVMIEARVLWLTWQISLFSKKFFHSGTSYSDMKWFLV